VTQLGVYIHYPYCRKLCPYCDFAVTVVPRAGAPHEAYVEALLAELAAAPPLPERRLVSIYLGGGTPSLLPPPLIGRLVAAARERFAATDAALEVTLEANPTDCTAEQMAAWRAAGINRVSIGVQSTDPAELALLGRDHHQGDGAAALRRALDAGFDAVSADVIIGVPGVGAADSVAAVADDGPPHLSVYELTIEARTHFGKRTRRGSLQPLGDDSLAARYEAAGRELASRGYEHYEISSYARPGFRAVHNSLYWSGGDYLGLGAGAASFVRDAGGGGQRWTNVRSAAAYLRAPPGQAVAERTPLSAAELTEDLLWLGMRTADGVAEELFTGREAAVEKLIRADLARTGGGRIRPTMRGFLLHDQVARWIVAGRR